MNIEIITNNLKYLIVIAGPTAVGKTTLSIEVAKALNTVILSADSRQFYKEMNIGTAKPAEAELALIKHYFINALSIHEPYSAGDFEKDAVALLGELFKTHDQVIMTGGSGLFIRAVCEGLDTFPDVPFTITSDLEQRLARQGLQKLAEELQQVDPVYYQTADINNPRRVLRALSVYYASGRPFSTFRTQTGTERNFEPIYICLELPRQELYERINARVDGMMEAGLAEEAAALYEHRQLKALQTVGYTELFDYFDKKLSLEMAVDKIRQHSRNYAKRQVTWFRKYGEWAYFHPADFIGVMRYIAGRIKQPAFSTEELLLPDDPK